MSMYRMIALVLACGNVGFSLYASTATEPVLEVGSPDAGRPALEVSAVKDPDNVWIDQNYYSGKVVAGLVLAGGVTTACVFLQKASGKYFKMARAYEAQMLVATSDKEREALRLKKEHYDDKCSQMAMLFFGAIFGLGIFPVGFWFMAKIDATKDRDFKSAYLAGRYNDRKTENEYYDEHYRKWRYNKEWAAKSPFHKMLSLITPFHSKAPDDFAPKDRILSIKAVESLLEHPVGIATVA
ncbi:MAG: hypothetical protein QG604_912 [Candidatus Dependentiae bacterium]|nr:hypothetical protein [Candidatus Dependentiae bacterium]